ncbi:hypothetical protein MMC10_001994 [Thelotrema lepadinum]|nr:hypothetical protein [Thelotrema lepadinum]
MAMCLSLVILFTSGSSSNQSRPEPTVLPTGQSDQYFIPEDSVGNEDEIEDDTDRNASDAPLLVLSASQTTTKQRTGLLQFLKPVPMDPNVLKLMSSRAMMPLLIADFFCPARLILVFEILIPFISIRYDKEIAQVSHL